ncbi:MAG TPA: NUDIX hydrolase [Ornithinimicrobium sp.]|uniref:NUDIX hydrolase n=1 Tax=Ornithinimicrobium sp. TaxID=1977084 RepID=UPI002B485255|nr:NUDIX hydrolase [Ornithinimicrobium sp.]HKJ11486.1 NUDIX hydrolase [Ornithinimicrobium sp.]
MGPWRIEPTGVGLATLTWDDREKWWTQAQAPAALRELLHAQFAAGVQRVQAEAPRGEVELRRALQRAGLRPEGIARGAQVDSEGSRVDVIRLARLADDPAPDTREGFLAMLNATLPTKRVIAQGLIRNEADEVLMCQLTYKKEWDLPGGVVDPHESPAAALAREVTEELGVEVSVGALLAIDWLPPYRQWDDAVLLVFDLGRHPELAAQADLQATEIAAVTWCDRALAGERCAPYVVRLLQHLGDAQRTAYLEDGVPLAAT